MNLFKDIIVSIFFITIFNGEVNSFIFDSLKGFEVKFDEIKDEAKDDTDGLFFIVVEDEELND